MVLLFNVMCMFFHELLSHDREKLDKCGIILLQLLVNLSMSLRLHTYHGLKDCNAKAPRRIVIRC